MDAKVPPNPYLSPAALVRRLWRATFSALSQWRRRMDMDRRPPKPTQVSRDVEVAQRIWAEVVLREGSDLFYDPMTGEALAVLDDPDHPVYLFLEGGRFRITNSVVGYDVTLPIQSELWASALFSRELHRRRKAFKEEALANVVHSLELLAQRLQPPPTNTNTDI